MQAYIYKRNKNLFDYIYYQIADIRDDGCEGKTRLHQRNRATSSMYASKRWKINKV